MERASQLNLELLAIYSEVIGDVEPIQERDEMAEALRHIEREEADYLLVTNSNRITRSQLGLLLFEEAILKPLGAKLFVCNEANFTLKLPK